MKVKWLNVTLISLFFCVFFFASFLHSPRGNYYTDYSLTQVLNISKKDSDIVIYFARNDCPECQKVDDILQSKQGELRKNTYRIETRSEKNREKLSSILSTLKIKEVPSFVAVHQQNKRKMNQNEVKKMLEKQ